MASLEDLPRLLATDAELREDFIATLVSFCRRHGIEAAPENFVGLPDAEDDTAGQRATLDAPIVLISRGGFNIGGGGFNFGGVAFKIERPG